MKGIIDIIVLCILVFFSLISHFEKDKSGEQPPSKKDRLKFILLTIGFLLVLYLLSPALYQKPDFTKLGKGFLVSDEIFNYIMIAIFTPLILFLLPQSLRKKFQLDRDDKDLLTGLRRLPGTHREFIFFVLFILAAALFEELIFRQFLFYSLNSIFGLRGDWLLIISSIFFMLAHKYKPRHMLGVFIAGLVLGKIYQHTESIFYPTLLHFVANLPVIISAMRRLNKPVETGS